METMPEIFKHKDTDVVSARDLYDHLGFSPTQWKRWYKKNIVGNGFFDEGIDYIVIDNMSKTFIGRPYEDFAITIDMVKHLSMMARTKKGKEIRDYFINSEKEARSLKMKLHQKEIELANERARTQQILAERAWDISDKYDLIRRWR